MLIYRDTKILTLTYSILACEILRGFYLEGLWGNLDWFWGILDWVAEITSDLNRLTIFASIAMHRVTFGMFFISIRSSMSKRYFSGTPNLFNCCGGGGAQRGCVGPRAWRDEGRKWSRSGPSWTLRNEELDKHNLKLLKINLFCHFLN